MEATKTTVLGNQPDTAQSSCSVSAEEYNAAKQIAEYMKCYPFGEAVELYRTIELTLKFAGDLKKAGFEMEKFWEIILFAGAIDIDERCSKEKAMEQE